MEAWHRVAGRDDRARHPCQGSGDAAAHRRRRGAGAFVERYRADAQGALVLRIACRLADWCGHRAVLAAAGGVVRGTVLLATVAGQGHRPHRLELRASPTVVVVSAAGPGAAAAVAVDVTRAGHGVDRFVAWSFRTVPLVLVGRAICRVLRDQRQADPLPAAAAAGVGAGGCMVVATTRCAPATAVVRPARAARGDRDRSVAVAGGEDVRLSG